MFWSEWFGTGDQLYEARFGRLERRFLRRSKRLPPPAWALARSAALSAQEMDHWLFLNPSSLFRDQLDALSPAGGSRIFLQLFAACLAALQADDKFPKLNPTGWQFLDALVAEVDPAEDLRPSRLAPLYSGQVGTPEFRVVLLEKLGEVLPAEPDLEQALTFGILAGQMLDKAAERCHRLL